MSWSEFIGFLISMFFMLFILLRPGWEARRKKNDPVGYAKEQKARETRMQKFLKQNQIAIERDEKNLEDEEEIEEEEEERYEERAKIAHIERKPEYYQATEERSNVNAQKEAKQKRMSTHLKAITTAANIQPPSMYQPNLPQAPMKMRGPVKAVMQAEQSRGNEILSRLKSTQEMFIIQEIIDRPKGLKEKPW